MVKRKNARLSRDDWISGALEMLSTTGAEGVKIVPLAKKLGVTSGSFYWHFKNRQELYHALLDHWEREMTDAAMVEAERFEGSPKDRIWNLMEQVMTAGLASYDLAFWHWAQTDPDAKTVFERTLDKRFAFSKLMFKQAGFSEAQAEVRGRMMVVYMMGESTLISDTPRKRLNRLRLKFEILSN